MVWDKYSDEYNRIFILHVYAIIIKNTLSNWKKIFSQLERLFFASTSRRFHRLQHFLLQMLIKPQEGGNEEEICHDPRHRLAEADARPRQGWH